MADLACPTCGSLNAPTRTFCWKCAADLRAVVDPTAPPAPPKVEVPIQPLLIGGGVALAAIALIALLVVVLGGTPAATTAPSFVPTAPTITAGATDGGVDASALPTVAPVTQAPPTAAPPTHAPPATPRITPIPGPTILSFTGPKTVNCSDQSFDGFITLTWEVAYADSTELSIDFPGVYKSYPGVAGTDRVPFGCGAGSHTYTLTTVGGNGPGAKKTLTITEG